MEVNMRNNDENAGIMAEVASLYFERGLSQQEIADRLFFSRSKVSRLLSKAIEEKVVEIKINYPMERVFRLENELKNIYQLKDVIVAKDYGTSFEMLMKRVTQMAAQHLDSILEIHTPIGITWGETVYHVVEEIKPTSKKHINVIQLMGTTESNNNSAYNTPELIRTLVDKYEGSFSQIYSPLVVENDIIRDSLAKEPIIQRVLNEARDAKVVLTSVGELYNSKTKAWESTLTPEVKKKLVQEGVVGVLLAHFIKMDGSLADPELDKKVIGISLDDLQNIENVVAVAVGTKKAKCLFGALNGGYINTLIIDELLARDVLKLYYKYRDKSLE
ncbi:hypothetical protein DXA09_07790 [Absiella sp. AM54-8XD]|jgi:deoxyribonucleoside regulator|nr:hypothetical protein DW271_16675 [Absiella sp. AM22-9]RGB58724.1 hypothetical protein DW120_13295 [Absiella sp. AM10-20]RGB64954.1 hypothetical protein DW113_13340 [Absiella sp. AM09-45]RGB74140.1 hypothetical protein DW114_14935 [Absiella sp. AM09-50]RGC23163.1 hypothetical protein DXA09_07790 [Absiella sp. AM54-8XD]RGC51868.1 hypothetical protein DW761_09340 [Absiella sp. AM29-15]RHU05710.1 hypothetical protein DW716_12675 [Absiella sp. AM27-20]